MRAMKGWILIHHRCFSVVLHLSFWFGQSIRQNYTNFGVLLEEVNEPIPVSMNERMGWFPVVVTGIKSPPPIQKLVFAFFVTLCLQNLLEIVLLPFADPIR